MLLGWTALAILLIVLTSLYFPVAVVQFVMMMRAVLRPPRSCRNHWVSDRRVLVVICTNGQNPLVVETILSRIKEFRLPVTSFVIKEAADPVEYSASQIVVPVGYSTPNGSRKKMRALQYGIEWLHARGYGRETYICHLDDDSVPEREYLEHIFCMEAEAGQGVIRLREFGHHTLSSFADVGRVFGCDSFCRHFNSIGRPMEVHGEGLTIRADVEFQLGWDYGTYGAEDLMMGQSVVRAGFRFAFIPHRVFIAPPLSARDFYRQRRRWAFSILWSIKEIRKIRPVSLYWLLYRYTTSWTGFVGLVILPLALLYGSQLDVPLAVLAISVFNTVSYFAGYQYGMGRTHRADMWKMLLLQFPVAAYEGSAVVYGLLKPPNRTSFEVIQKA